MNRELGAYLEHYSGDDAWRDFVDAYSPEPVVLRSNGAQMTFVLERKGLDAEKWLSSSPPALYGTTPRKLMKLGQEGISIVREIIMRMPF